MVEEEGELMGTGRGNESVSESSSSSTDAMLIETRLLLLLVVCVWLLESAEIGEDAVMGVGGSEFLVDECWGV